MDGQINQNILRQESAVHYFTGILGALIGALIGAVPWFLVSTFTGFFVGWLGFIVAWCSYFGYTLFRGVKNKAFAMTVIVIFSIAAIILSDFAGNMISICRDPDLQALASMHHYPIEELAYMTITDPNNRSAILPNLLIGLAIGILGIISIRKQVANYVGPAGNPAFDPAAQPAQFAQPVLNAVPTEAAPVANTEVVAPGAEQAVTPIAETAPVVEEVAPAAEKIAPVAESAGETETETAEPANE